MSLLEDLKGAVPTQAATPPPPPGFRPGVTYSGRTPSEIVTPPLGELDGVEDWERAVRDMGVPIPEGFTLHLVEALFVESHNPASWMRDPEHRGANHTAYTAPNTVSRWRYKFKVVPISARADADIAALMREAKRVKRKAPSMTRTGGSAVINLADFQTGKVDQHGGTAELLERSEIALAEAIAWVRKHKPAEIILVDPGDSTEGFESAPNADRMNDLSQTSQIRVWRRILWRWIDALAPLAPALHVLGVPSNHCRVRRGKQNLGAPADDWGLEVIAQVADIAKSNPEAYGHVSFTVPATDYEEHVLVTLVDGRVLGVVHGHQVSRPDQLPEYIKRNARSGIGRADIVVAGHFHHLRAQAFGDGQYLFVCPAMDNGSSWFASSGEASRPGLLMFMVDGEGWRDMNLAWF